MDTSKLEVGKTVTLKDNSQVTVLEIANDRIFIARQSDGKKGIFYASQINSDSHIDHCV